MASFLSRSPETEAIFARSDRNTGVTGYHGDPHLNETTAGSESVRAGIFGASENGPGVLGYARDDAQPAVYAFGGLLAIALDKEFAGIFRGDVKVEGDILLTGADCAEQFDFVDADGAEPGSVVVIDEGGHLCECSSAYDRRVAGVVAGAGDYRPGIVLDSSRPSRRRSPVSLVGKVFCKVDGTFGPIGVGDLLTTSGTPGHAMRAGDPRRAFGAILGKALKPWRSPNRGMIPVLVALA